MATDLEARLYKPSRNRQINPVAWMKTRFLEHQEREEAETINLEVRKLHKELK